jgi:hypothetical protein
MQSVVGRLRMIMWILPIAFFLIWHSRMMQTQVLPGFD